MHSDNEDELVANQPRIKHRRRVKEFEEFHNRQSEELKLKINEFLFENLPDNCTLGEMETLAGEIFFKIMDQFDLSFSKLELEAKNL